jgi:hypothetical protein
MAYFRSEPTGSLRTYLQRSGVERLFYEKRYEYAMALIAAAWGLVLLDPTKETFTSAPVFRIMAEIAPENIWGTVYLLFGIISLITTKCEPAFALGCHKIFCRRVISVLGVFAWIVLSITYGIGSPANTAYVIYAGLALISALNLINSMERGPW